MLKNIQLLTLFFIFHTLQSQDINPIEFAKGILVTEPLMEMKDQILPKFDAKTIVGESISSSDLEGKPTILKIWFKECQPCLDEMPLLNKIYKEYSDQLNLYSLTFNSKEEVLDLLDKREFKFNHIYGMRNYLDELGIKFYPKSIILDRHNRIVKVIGKPFMDECKHDEDGYLGCYNDLTHLIDELLPSEN